MFGVHSEAHSSGLFGFSVSPPVSSDGSVGQLVEEKGLGPNRTQKYSITFLQVWVVD